LYDSIVKLSPDGRVLERREFTFGSRPGQFKTITGLAADSAGNIYAADYLNNRVQKLSPSGVPLDVWRGNRVGGPGLSHPQGLTLDSRDNLYVVDSNAGRVVNRLHLGVWLRVPLRSHWHIRIPRKSDQRAAGRRRGRLQGECARRHGR
jgi:sugar lactone lactonase YvrE